MVNLSNFMSQYGFDSVDMDEAMKLNMLGTKDPIISQIMRMKLNHVFVNEMIFTRKDTAHKDSEMLRESWEKQLRVIMRNVWSNGFGVCVNMQEMRRLRSIDKMVRESQDVPELFRRLHAKYKFRAEPTEIVTDLNFLQMWSEIGAEPDDGLWDDEQTIEDDCFAEALNIAQLEVFCKRDWSSTQKFVYFIPMMMPNHTTVHVRVRNAFTICDDMDGMTSRVAQLVPSLMLERKTRECYEISISSRAAPYVAFETDQKAKGDFDVDEEVQNNLDVNRTNAVPRDIRGSYEHEVDGIDTVVATRRALKPYVPERDPNVPVQSYSVPKNMKIGRHPEAHEPAYYNEVSEMRWKEGFGVMEIPLGLLSIYSLHMKKGQGIMSNGGATFSIDSIHYRLFQESNGKLASILTAYINKVIGHSMIERVATNNALQMWESDAEEIDSQIAQRNLVADIVQVNMPKNLEPDKILSLIASGMLKYDAGIALFAKATHIDPSSLSETRPKNLEQLVGIKKETAKPPKRKASSSSTKKAKKAKT